MVNAAAYGNEGTAMMPFTTQHTAEEIAAVIDYIRDTFMGADINPSSVPTTIQGGHTDHDGPLLAARTPADPHAAHGHGATEGDMTAPYPDSLVGDASKGKAFFEDNCTDCHGMKGAGDGPRAYFINPKPRDLTSPKARVELNRPHLFSAVSMGVKGREMAAWSKVYLPPLSNPNPSSRRTKTVWIKRTKRKCTTIRTGRTITKPMEWLQKKTELP
jgi:mono/diheme cytochrome c family protein